MMSVVLLAAFLLALQARAQGGALTAPATAQAPAEEAPQFDPSQYPLMTLAKAAAAAPCGGGKTKYELKDRLFSAEIVFQGSVRQAPPSHFELIKRWTKSIGDPEAASRYKKQVSFSEGKKVVWMSLPEGLIDYLRDDLQVGDRALVYGVFVGCVNGKPLFSVDEYETYAPADEESEDYITRALEAGFGRTG
ncbi:MAG: hypothetical protein HY922_09910 [Elusimicrobia bacterium]|nr:hypothetical protein [Elusimicrobiota bacterium]